MYDMNRSCIEFNKCLNIDDENFFNFENITQVYTWVKKCSNYLSLSFH